jgi:hypothetical protein
MPQRNPLYISDDNSWVEAGGYGTIMYEWHRWIIYNWAYRTKTPGNDFYMSYVASGGQIQFAMDDTRLVAGNSTTRTDRFATRAETPDPGINTVTYRRINAHTPLSPPVAKPVPKLFYYDNGLKVFTQRDMLDTFIVPCVDYLEKNDTGVTQAGTYTISTSPSLPFCSLQGTVFTDTQANVSLYDAANIPETADQPIINQNYYLHFINGDPAQPSQRNFVQADQRHNWKSPTVDFTAAPFQTFTDWCVDALVFTLGQDVGNRLEYELLTDTSPGSGQTARGTLMSDTILDSSDYNTRFVDADDYRTQEFPGGSSTTASTYQLVISRT